MRTKNEEYFKMIEAFIDEHKEKCGAAPTENDRGSISGLYAGTWNAGLCWSSKYSNQGIPDDQR